VFPTQRRRPQFRSPWLTRRTDRSLRLGAPLPALDRLAPRLGAAVAGSLQVLTLEGSLGACADPIFGTPYELQRQALEAGKDVFAALAAAFEPSPGGCRLRRLKVSRGSFSAASFERFVRAARPPLEALEFESALLHGRSYPGIVAALCDAHPCPDRLVEFATNEHIGGEDPIALLARAFPGLRALKVKRLFGSGPPRGPEAFRQLFPRLQASRCCLPRAMVKLRGGFKIDNDGGVQWFVTSDRHDDGYRGQGLSWSELDNTCECMFCWKVGHGVARQQVLDFMRECGIEYQQQIADSIEVSDEEPDEDDEDGEEGEEGEEGAVTNQEQHANCVVEGCAVRDWVPPDDRSEDESMCNDESENDDQGEDE